MPPVWVSPPIQAMQSRTPLLLPSVSTERDHKRRADARSIFEAAVALLGVLGSNIASCDMMAQNHEPLMTGYATSKPCLCASFAVTGEVTGNCSTVAC
jgi:hypothetical protein